MATLAPAISEELSLPKAVVKRLIKKQLAQHEDPAMKEANISAEALLAFSEAAKVFISYIMCTANDICLEQKRQTVSVDDVFTAIEELEFDEMMEPLRAELEKHRQESKEKAAAAKERAAARKAAANAGSREATPAEGGQAEGGPAEEGPAGGPADVEMQPAGGIAEAGAGEDAEDSEETEDMDE